MSDDVHEIARQFAERFSRWGIALPAADVEQRKGGHVFAGGWHIGYLWGADGVQEYLECFAQHRMTNDSHWRLFASGKTEHLPAPNSMVAIPPGASKAEIERASDENAERNRVMYAELRARGLLPPAGANLPAHNINERLASGRYPRHPDGG